MLKRVHQDKRIACYYTTRAEADTPEVKTYLQREFAACKARQMVPAVFYSGADDLPDLTSAMLAGSRKRMAEREVKAERAKNAARSS